MPVVVAGPQLRRAPQYDYRGSRTQDLLALTLAQVLGQEFQLQGQMDLQALEGEQAFDLLGERLKAERGMLGDRLSAEKEVASANRQSEERMRGAENKTARLRVYAEAASSLVSNGLIAAANAYVGKLNADGQVEAAKVAAQSLVDAAKVRGEQQIARDKADPVKNAEANQIAESTRIIVDEQRRSVASSEAQNPTLRRGILGGEEPISVASVQEGAEESVKKEQNQLAKLTEKYGSFMQPAADGSVIPGTGILGKAEEALYGMGSGRIAPEDGLGDYYAATGALHRALGDPTATHSEIERQALRGWLSELNARTKEHISELERPGYDPALRSHLARSPDSSLGGDLATLGIRPLGQALGTGIADLFNTGVGEDRMDAVLGGLKSDVFQQDRILGNVPVNMFAGTNAEEAVSRAAAKELEQQQRAAAIRLQDDVMLQEMSPTTDAPAPATAPNPRKGINLSRPQNSVYDGVMGPPAADSINSIINGTVAEMSMRRRNPDWDEAVRTIGGY